METISRIFTIYICTTSLALAAVNETHVDNRGYHDGLYKIVLGKVGIHSVLRVRLFRSHVSSQVVLIDVSVFE